MAVFLLGRMATRSAVPEDEKEDFDYASTAPVVAMGVEEAWDQEDQLLVPEGYEHTEEEPVEEKA
jgi:hypothetical protein